MPAEIAALDNVHPASSGDGIDTVHPHWLAEPETTEQAAAILACANEEGLAVAPRGGGTKLGWGNPPERLDLILSTARMNRVLEHAAGDLVARLEAGTRLQAAQETFARASQWLPIDPPERDATIGGIIATNASGPHRLRYGTMRDLLIGITYVLPDGTVARAGGKVVKNVAGYDLCKLFTGSLGTLGLLTKVIVRLHPVPAARRVVTLATTGVREVGAAVQALLHSHLVPGAVELLPGENARLAVLFEGVEPGVVAQAEAAVAILRAHGGDVKVTDDWDPPALPERPPSACRLKIALPVAALADPAVIDGIIARTHGGPEGGRLWGHAGNGILYGQTAPGEPEEQAGAIRALRDLVAAHGGSVVIQEAPVEVKRLVDVWGDPGDAIPLMRRIKEMYDPRRVMNPGRFIGGL